MVTKSTAPGSLTIILWSVVKILILVFFRTEGNKIICLSIYKLGDVNSALNCFGFILF